RLDRSHKIFEHSGTLVIVELRAEVGKSRCVSNLDNQFGDTVDKLWIGLRLASKFGQDAQQGIRLWLALPSQDRGGTAEGLYPRGLLGVIAEPDDHRNPRSTVLETARTGHVNHAVDQLGPSAWRRRFIEPVEGGLVESQTLDERAERSVHRRGIGH